MEQILLPLHFQFYCCLRKKSILYILLQTIAITADNMDDRTYRDVLFRLEYMKDSLNDKKDKAAPLVSVIVLTYRKFDNLYKALLSVTKQTYSNLELIIQDDGSEFFPEDEIRSYLREQGTA